MLNLNDTNTKETFLTPVWKNQPLVQAIKIVRQILTSLDEPMLEKHHSISPKSVSLNVYCISSHCFFSVLSHCSVVFHPHFHPSASSVSLTVLNNAKLALNVQKLRTGEILPSGKNNFLHKEEL